MFLLTEPDLAAFGLAILFSFFLMFFARQGSKTQLLSEAYGATESFRMVFPAVTYATTVTYMMSALVGMWLTQYVPSRLFILAAPYAFLLFGLRLLKSEKLKKDELSKNQKKVPDRSAYWVITGAVYRSETLSIMQFLAFLLGGIYSSVIPVWLGATFASFLADGYAIREGKRGSPFISRRFMRLLSALVLISFGAALFVGIPLFPSK